MALNSSIAARIGRGDLIQSYSYPSTDISSTVYQNGQPMGVPQPSSASVSGNATIAVGQMSMTTVGVIIVGLVAFAYFTRGMQF